MQLKNTDMVLYCEQCPMHRADNSCLASYPYIITGHTCKCEYHYTDKQLRVLRDLRKTIDALLGYATTVTHRFMKGQRNLF